MFLIIRKSDGYCFLHLKLLGTAPGLSFPDKSHSSYWIEHNDSIILLDCGEGTTRRVLEENLDFDSIDAIIISHFHPDHISGIFMLIQNMHIKQRKKVLDIFLPERRDEFVKIMQYFYLFPKRLSFKINLKDMRNVEETYSWIRPIANDHLQYLSSYVQKHKFSNSCSSWSFLLNTSNRDVFISCDIKDIALLESYKMCDILIVDGYHLKAREFASVVCFRDETNLSKIVLTHGVSKDLLALYRSKITEVFELAEDGKKIDI